MSRPEWIPEDATPEEEELLRKHVIRGSDVDPIPKIPDAPDIIPPPEKAPEPSGDKIAGRAELKPGELPRIGEHFVIWGSKLLDDIRERSVKRAAHLTEDEYAARLVADAKALVAAGVKDPDPHLPDKYPKTRAERAEHYARWRYKGYVCGEVFSL